MNWVLVSVLLLLPAASWCSPEYPHEGIHVNSEEEHLEGIDVQTKQDDLAGIEVKVGEEQLNEIDVNVEVKNLAGIDVKAGNDHLIGIVVNDDNHLEGIDEKTTYNHMLDTPVKTVEGFHHSGDVKTEKEHLSQLSERGDQKGIDKMIVNIFKPEEDPTEVELANQTDLDSIQVQEADPLSPALNDNSAALNKRDDTVGESEYGILMTRLMDMIGVGESGTNATDIDSNAQDELSSEIDVKAEEEFTSAIDVKAKEHLSQDEINMISKIYMSKYEDLTGSNEMADDQQLTEIDLTIQDENPTGNDAAVEENDSSEIGFVEQSKAFVAKLFDMIGVRNSNNSPPKTCSSSSALYYADLTDTNCMHFYHCSDGDELEPYLVECSPGTRWAPKLHTCDDEENVLCPRTSSDEMSVARCEFKGEGTGEVFGEVIIIQVKDDVNGSHFQGKIIGLAPGLHGFHVHAVGNLSNDCKAAGGHFNPNNVTHGRKDDDVRHVGDLGNLETGENGAMLVDLWDSVALLNGTNSIIGKAIVVHEGQDDEGSGGNNGSLVHGNAGARAGCCIIEEV